MEHFGHVAAISARSLKLTQIGVHWQMSGVITLASGRWSCRGQGRVVWSEDRRALCFCVVAELGICWVGSSETKYGKND